VIVEIPHRSFDRHGTDFDNECFKESFARQLPEMKREHLLRIGEGLRAEVLPHANRLVGQFDDSVPAERTFHDIAEGRLRGWSFHYLNAESVRHPVVPGGLRYVKADMDEFSAVRSPSIPGTKTAGLRSEPDLAQERLALLDRARAHGERATGRRSVLNPYERPEEFIEGVRARASDVLDDMVEQRYLLFEMQRDGLLPKTPSFRLGEIFARHQPIERNRRCL
jgi:hypothetical protein